MVRKRLPDPDERDAGPRGLERLLGAARPEILDIRATPPPDGPAASSTSPRIICTLLMDMSNSMFASGANAAVTRVLPEFREAILKDSLTARKLSWAVLTYAETPKLVRGYGPVADWTPPAELTGGYGTASGTAIIEMFRLQNEHIDALASQGIPIQHSFCFHVTDGEPNSEPPERMEEAARLIEHGEESGRFSFHSIGVEKANMEVLRRLTPRRTPLRHSDVDDFAPFFAWLNVSLRTASNSMVGERVKLPSPLKSDPGNLVGWGEI